MRYVFRFGLALALGLALMAGCSDENGEGGSGGAAGTGGMAGMGGDGGVGGTGGTPECESAKDCDDAQECTLDTCDAGTCNNTPASDTTCEGGTCIFGYCALSSCDGIADGTVCAYEDNPYNILAGGLCLDGSCGQSCESLDDGTVCTIYPFGYVEICRDGTCRSPECGTDADCDDLKDCTTDRCLDPGLCERVAVEDGTPCAGGACEAGHCVLEVRLPCTEQGIRNAAAAGGGPYTFDCDGPTTISLSAGISIDKDVILDAAGNLTLRGEPLIFFVAPTVTAELRGWTVEKIEPPNTSGGWVIGNEGTLTLSNSTVTKTWTGIAISSHSRTDYGALTVINSTVSGIRSYGMLEVRDSTVSGSPTFGIFTQGTATIINSTVIGNGNEYGGGIYTHTPSEYIRGSLALINTTVSGNAAFGILNLGTSTTLVNSTVSGNTPTLFDASGILNVYEPGQEERTTLTLINTLIENDCDGLMGTVSLGHNIESPGDTCGFDQPTDQVNITAEQLKLGPLKDNGGPTMTHALGAGSVAIDEIAAEHCLDADGEALTTDQRGEPRPETGGTMCDVGAFEVQP